jgi:hypothetical protein
MPAARPSKARAAQRSKALIALADLARPASGTCWRVVEAQHYVATLPLVDSLAEQARLEHLLEATKPTLPPECRGLDYLLATPFRYRPYPQGSRFRRAGATPGVFYAAADVETAIAEAAFYRLLFFAESPATPFPGNASEHTAFSARYGGKAVDLTAPPLARRRNQWLHPTAYGPCQDLADQARAAQVDLIRYASVRDPARRMNVALLTCRAFRAKAPLARQTWRLRVGATGIQALCEFPRARLDFDCAAFAADARLAHFNWVR